MYHEWGCEKTFKYPVVKLTDWRGRLGELEASPNVFALFVLGHLWGQTTEKDMERRLEQKLRLLSLLMERKLDEVDFGAWRSLFDWQLRLPPEGEQHVQEWIRQKRMEGVMPFVSNFEKVAREEGRDEGLKEGLLRGALVALKGKFGAAGANLGPRLARAEFAALETVLAAIEAEKPFDEIERLLPAE